MMGKICGVWFTKIRNFKKNVALKSHFFKRYPNRSHLILLYILIAFPFVIFFIYRSYQFYVSPYHRREDVSIITLTFVLSFWISDLVEYRVHRNLYLRLAKVDFSKAISIHAARGYLTSVDNEIDTLFFLDRKLSTGWTLGFMFKEMFISAPAFLFYVERGSDLTPFNIYTISCFLFPRFFFPIVDACTSTLCCRRNLSRDEVRNFIDLICAS
jgi:hypothetical protein